MFAILDALEDARKVTLCFASKADAERFKVFANIYMEESGAGNGYGAYSVMFDEQIVQVDVIPNGCSTELNTELIDQMLDDIITARKASTDTVIEGIVFDDQKLPPQKRPTSGDMFRALRSKGAKAKLEGRVIKDHGDYLDVISCYDEDDEGNPKPDADILTIPTDHTMKINDWKTAMRIAKV